MKRILTFTAIFIFSAASAHAGLVESFGIGAKEASQGKAVAAQADTPFAVYYNPAGLTQIEGPTFSAGATVYDATVSSDNFRLKVKDTDTTITNQGWDTDNETDNDPLVNPAMGYAMPISKKLSIGVAAYAPYGLHLESNKNPYENPVSFYAWESMYTRTAVTPTIAYKLNDKISVGFGVSLGQSESNAGKTYRVNPFQAKLGNKLEENSDLLTKTAGAIDDDLAKTILGVTKNIGGDVKTSTKEDIATKSVKNKLKLETDDDFNASWNAGIMYKASDKLSMGLTYRSRTDADFEGDVFFKGTKIGAVTMDYDHPEQVQGGIRYAFSDSFSVEFDLTFTHWSINNEQVEKVSFNPEMKEFMLGEDIYAELATLSQNKEAFDTEVKKAVLAGDLTSEEAKEIDDILKEINSNKTDFSHDRDWDNTIQYQLGAEWLVNDKLSLRGGIIYDPTPVPDHTFDQGWPDTDRTVFNIGAGYKITDQWEIDTVFQYITSTPPRDINGDSDELNDTFTEEVMLNKQQVDVYMDDNKGILYGLGATVTYSF